MGLVSSLKSMAGSLGGIVGLGAGSLVGAPTLGYSLGSSIGNSVQSNYVYGKNLSDQYKLIQYQNEYNAPVNQMARLQEAGLNPNLVYGNGGSTVVSANGSIPKYNMPEVSPVAQYYNLVKQNELLDAQRDVAYWKAGEAQQNLEKINAQARIARYNADYAEHEHKAFKQSGKIPASYYKSQNSLQTFDNKIDQLLQYFSN